jgi:putative transposase
MARSGQYYKLKRLQNDAKVIARMKELIEKQNTIGCKMMHDILSRERLVVNHKRTERIYRDQRFSLKVRKRKRRISQIRLELPKATKPNERWSMDFMQAVLAGGRRFRILCVIDQFTKECLLVVVDFSINGQRVARELDFLLLTRGKPEAITVDNGPEFAGIALDRWAYNNQVKLDFIRPGKPVENAFIESFNGIFRHECLNQHYFKNLHEARNKIAEWLSWYNEFRPHQSLKGLTPAEFVKQWQKNNNKTPKKLYLQTV